MSFQFSAVQDLLRCPKSHSRLVHEGQTLICVDPDCRLRFTVRDDIPVMLVDDAVELTPEEWQQTMQRCGHSPPSGH